MKEIIENWNCENCGENFYTDITSDPPLGCPHCGHFDIYGTYTYYIEPTMFEVNEVELEDTE